MSPLYDGSRTDVPRIYHNIFDTLLEMIRNFTRFHPAIAHRSLILLPDAFLLHLSLGAARSDNEENNIGNENAHRCQGNNSADLSRRSGCSAVVGPWYQGFGFHNTPSYQVIPQINIQYNFTCISWNRPLHETGFWSSKSIRCIKWISAVSRTVAVHVVFIRRKRVANWNSCHVDKLVFKCFDTSQLQTDGPINKEIFSIRRIVSIHDAIVDNCGINQKVSKIITLFPNLPGNGLNGYDLREPLMNCCWPNVHTWSELQTYERDALTIRLSHIIVAVSTTISKAKAFVTKKYNATKRRKGAMFSFGSAIFVLVRPCSLPSHFVWVSRW